MKPEKELLRDFSNLNENVKKIVLWYMETTNEQRVGFIKALYCEYPDLMKNYPELLKIIKER